MFLNVKTEKKEIPMTKINAPTSKNMKAGSNSTPIDSSLSRVNVLK